MAQRRQDDDLAYVQSGMGGDLETVLVYNILRTESYLAPFLDAGLRDQRLTAAQFNALLVLRAAGKQGMLMSRIGERLVVTRSNVTGLIDRLEQRGLVARGTCDDRRATAIRLTDAGRSLLDRSIPRHAELLSELTDCLTDHQKRQLVKLLTKLRSELRQRRSAAQG